MSVLDNQQNSFVVRIWWQRRSPADVGASWHGWVQHTRSGEAMHVQTVHELLTFLEHWTGQLEPISRNSQTLK